MALDRIYVEVSGERELIRRLENVSKNIQDSTERNEQVYKQFWIPKMRRMFDTEGADGGEKWQELSKSYEAQKARRYGSKPILRATDRLERSLATENSDTIKEIDKFTATFGSRVPYFKYVNKIRPVVQINERDKRDIKNIFVRDIESFVREQGF